MAVRRIGRVAADLLAAWASCRATRAVNDSERDPSVHSPIGDAKCVEHGEKDGRVNYVDGANIAGFKKVADVMLTYGVV